MVVVFSRMVVAGLLLSLGGVARAEVYQYTDEDGVVHYSNVPNDPRFKKIKDLERAERKEPVSVPWTRFPSDKSIYDDCIQAAAEKYNIPEPLVRAVMAVESNFNPNAVSHAGAQGLMQLMPATAQEMGVLDVFDPGQNILGGTRYLRVLANLFGGDLVLTLAAYNAGHRAVTNANDIPPIAETQQYVRRVLQLYFHYKRPKAPATPQRKTPVPAVDSGRPPANPS